MDKRTDEPEEAAVDHHGGGDTGSWLGFAAELGEREREARADRISRWADTAGPPHAEITLRDDPEHTDRIGFWRVTGGVMRIRASGRRGEFDPAKGIDITDAEAKAIASAFARPCPPPPADKGDECNAASPCCGRAGEYNGYASGPLAFTCPKHCPCHD